jgi:hypothetical protein
MTSEEREKQFPSMAKFVVDQVFPLYQQPSLFQSLGFSVSQKKHQASSLDLKMVEELQVCEDIDSQSSYNWVHTVHLKGNSSSKSKR